MLLLHMFYRIKFGRSKSNRLGVGRSHKQFGDAVAPPLGVRAWLTVWKHATPAHVLSYQIWSLFGKPFGHMRGDSKISERWAPPLGCRGVADPSETRFSTTCVIMPNLVIPDPPEKMTPRVTPSEVTQGHWNRHGSIGYL